MATQYGTSNTIDDIKGKARQGFDEAADRAQDLASRAQDIAGQARDQVGEVAGNVKGAVDKSIKEQPLTTLLAAAAIGFVIGAIWKS
jgi:ElaB/YqjD/DUF883 family membrane-anchored ribosome-binding protein